MIRFEDASFHYGGEQGTGEGVDNIDLLIADGECVVLCGRSGCGKTTVTRMINGLVPHFYEGEMEGAVYVDDTCVATAELSDTAALVGSVFQNPKSQFFNVDTTGELAFGCENLGLPREEVRARVDRTRADLKLDVLMDRNIFELSGGEKQQVACGSVYATDPRVYVMDEPSSNLDRGAMRRLRDAIARIKAEGKTVVISEHRLHYLMDLVDRFIYLDDGRITREFTASELLALADDELASLGLRTPELSRIRRDNGLGAGSAPSGNTVRGNGIALEALDLSCARGGVQIIDIEHLLLPEHAIVALVGDNGSGKSTLSEALCGVAPAEPERGHVPGGACGLEAPLRLRPAVASSVHPHRDVGLLQHLERTAHALLAERALVVQAGRVRDKARPKRRYLHGLRHRVRRRPCDVAHYGDLLADELVHER